MGTSQAIDRAPFVVRLFNPIMRAMLSIGLPLGPNVLLTVAGRKSGLPRTTPVAMLEIGGRRWVVGTMGDVNWVRNLRAAGGAEICRGRRAESVRSAELAPHEATAFFRDRVGPYVASMALPGRVATSAIVRLSAPEIFDDPESAGRSRPVFELHGIGGNPSAD